ncbi:MAG: glycine--tRNA ligase subunit beta [Chloroflexota bacterium]
MIQKDHTFQQVIMKLHQFWADQGCVLWRPYNVQVGAGTGNPATLLRVLGPEPWRVAYVEPSVRPDDGRYGENPNRLQMHTQYQVILKPDPGNPQELYLQSLEAVGLSRREHDIRFVEDNWESPALGAWGLGWEVWLDGQEITQFTYFQQAGGIELDPVSVEITYGLERIVLALQNKNSAWDIQYMAGDADSDGDGNNDLLYQDIFLRQEFEHSKYYFEVADIDGLKQEYDFYAAEYKRALENDLLIPAYDYVLKCSHVFNVLDTRGAVGVTERAKFFRQMRDMTRDIAKAVVDQRQEMEYPLEKMTHLWAAPALQEAAKASAAPDAPADVLLEIGVEELPAHEADRALAQLEPLATALFEDLRLKHDGVRTYATPRRLVIAVRNVAPVQLDAQDTVKGPPAERAFDADGNPTKAAQGFARGKGVDVSALRVEEVDGGQYVVADVFEAGRPAVEVLAEALPGLIADIKFGKNMRWNQTNIGFSRPLRWIVAMHGDRVIPFTYAGVASGDATRGIRPYGSPEVSITSFEEYGAALNEQGVILDRDTRQDDILRQAQGLAQHINGLVLRDDGLLDEVTNLVEAPTAFMGAFSKESLELPRQVLITVMRKHQRYFAIVDTKGNLLPYFIAVRNGDAEHIEKVRHGNEQVLRARYADAKFFFDEDRKKPLADFLPRLGTLTFHEKIGSMLEKNDRVAGLVAAIGKNIGVSAEEIETAAAAGKIAKADLATQMVVEMTSLQGVMGTEYALREGYPEPVAKAIFEHWLPRSADDFLPKSVPGALLSITDKLDTLAGLFGAGLAPKGSADPFGLRRAALGLVQVIIEHDLDVDLRALLDIAAEAQPIDVSAANRAAAIDFIRGRLEVWLLDQDWAHDVVQAVLAEQAHNPTRTLTGIKELSEWVKRDDWENILDGFARCVRITRSLDTVYGVDESVFVEDAEQALYAAYTEAAAKVTDEANVNAFLNAFEPMLPAVTQFFDDVLVMAEDEAVKHNRLGLLQAISGLAAGRADLSQLSGF